MSGSYANTNPTLAHAADHVRVWHPGRDENVDRRQPNLVPDCDPRNPGAQDLRDSGGDLCGVMSNTNFGQNILTNTFDPAILNGWGVRPSDWNLGVSIEQQIAARGSVSVYLQPPLL